MGEWIEEYVYGKSGEDAVGLVDMSDRLSLEMDIDQYFDDQEIVAVANRGKAM